MDMTALVGAHDWHGVKNCVKQFCGGKRKGESEGRPPSFPPWARSAEVEMM